MNKKHYSKVGKYISMACLLFVCAMVQSCRDEYFFDDTAPDFVGPSIYDYLDGQGNFTYFLKVVDDLDYDEVLDRTGSKTLFVADDVAFMKGIKEEWGFDEYSQLTPAHKRIILKNAMLDNAYLLEMLSKMQSTGVNAEPIPGQCLRQESSAAVTDTIGLFTYRDLPKNNPDWEIFREGNVRLALDATQPMMLHFIEEQLYQKNITEDDLQVLVGDESAQLSDIYIFDKKVLLEKDENGRYLFSDITCKNGYVHQLDGLLIPPSNMAEEIRKNGNELVKEDGTFKLADLNAKTTQLFSRMLDRFAVPVPISENNEVSKVFHDNYVKAGTTEQLYEKRYYTEGSVRGAAGDYLEYTDVDKQKHDALAALSFDPGWNAYKAGTTDGVKSEHDMAAILVPSDAAVIDYFVNKSGRTLIERYGGDVPNNLDINGGLLQAIDSIPVKIIEPLVRNHMQMSFNSSVPSKFENIMNDARDPMGVKVADIEKVMLANNGVVYVMNTLYNPARYSSVIAPVMLSDSLTIFNKFINDLDYDQYLLSMGNKFGLVVSSDANMFYYAPADEKIDNQGKPVVTDATKPKAYKFVASTNAEGNLAVEAIEYTYNRETYDTLTNTYASVVKTSNKGEAGNLFKEIMEYNIIVGDLNSERDCGMRKLYYPTKGNGTVKVERGADGKVTAIAGGRELQNGAVVPVANTYGMDNGQTFQLNGSMIQPATKTVYNVLYSTPEFKEFYDLCNPSDKVLEYILGAETDNEEEWEKYQIFDDILVRFFENFHYTVYVPSSEALASAYEKGLPTWDDLAVQIDEFGGAANDSLKKVIKSGADLITKFVRYHFQDNSVYVDNARHALETDQGDIDGDGIRDYVSEYIVDYTTSVLNEKTKQFCEVRVYTEGNMYDAERQTITVQGDIQGMDNKCHVINTKETENKLFNVMVRDNLFDGSSSYAVIHLIDNFLVFGGDGGIFDPEKVNEETGEKGMFVR